MTNEPKQDCKHEEGCKMVEDKFGSYHVASGRCSKCGSSVLDWGEERPIQPQAVSEPTNQNDGNLPEWMRKIAAEMFPQITKRDYSQWDVEKLLIRIGQKHEEALTNARREGETSKYAWSFYRFGDSRDVIPEQYKEGILWFLKSMEEFDEDEVNQEAQSSEEK